MSLSSQIFPQQSLLENILGQKLPGEDQEVQLSSGRYVMKEGILRHSKIYSKTQAQTQSAFHFLWANEVLDHAAERFQENWFEEHFPGVRTELRGILKPGSRVLDAGCGAGFSALAFFGAYLNEIQYLGVDISGAADYAKKHFAERSRKGEFLQSSITTLPFSSEVVDFVFTPGVLHHTDSIAASLKSLTDILVPGGRILLWVYRKQPPLREFADDFIRQHLSVMNDQEAYKALVPLTKLGETLGRLKVTLDVPEEIAFLGIPKGKMDLQRFFYYYVLKTFYNHTLPFERANMQNFDWYRPLNAQTSTFEEMAQHCTKVNLEVERHWISPSGISILATKSLSR